MVDDGDEGGRKEGFYEVSMKRMYLWNMMATMMMIQDVDVTEVSMHVRVHVEIQEM